MGRMCSQLSLCNKVKIPSKKEHWGFKYLIESTPMIGYKYIRSRLSIEINTILESLKKKKNSLRNKVLGDQKICLGNFWENNCEFNPWIAQRLIALSGNRRENKIIIWRNFLPEIKWSVQYVHLCRPITSIYTGKQNERKVLR